MRENKIWTTKEEEKARDMYCSGAKIIDIANEIGRTIKATEYHINQILNLKRMPRWSEEEKEQLEKTNRSKMAIKAMKHIMKRKGKNENN